MIPAFRYLALALLALASLVSTVSAAPGESDFTNTVVLTDDQGEYPLGRHLMILEDPTNALTLDDVRKPEYADKFVPSTKDTPGYGFSPSAYWVKVDIDRQTTQEAQWLLEFGYAPMQWVDVYTVATDGIIRSLKGGSGLKHSERPYRHHKHIFELRLTPEKTTHLYVRVSGDTSKNIPLTLHRADVFAQSTSHELAMFSIYAGIIIALVCYNLFIYITLREPAYLHYVLFLCASISFILAFSGITQTIVFPDRPAAALRLLPLMTALTGLFGLLFAIRFLDLSARAPTLFRCAIVLIAFAIVTAVCAWFAPYAFAAKFVAAFVAVATPFLILVGCVLVLRGHVIARYFLVAWLLFLVGCIAAVLRTVGVLPINAFTEHLQMWGSAAEAILLSIALAARMRVMKEEKERAQLEQLQAQEALNISQAETVAAQQESLNNKQIALDTIQKYSIKLEAEVKARTTELIDTQQKLIASEKMAALGVFTAGMAHEINNPANFVAAGAQNADYAVQKLQTFVGELLDDDADPDIKGEFNSHFTKIAGAHEVIKTGIKRIENVVKQLRSDHPEGDVGMQPADVVESLESAWRVLSPTVKTPIVLSAQLDSRPQVSCMIAEIQQVFLALLSNAAHAIEDAVAVNGPDYQGEIKLASHETEGKLVITLSDNGIGIPADKLDKVFDPFFTTKTVGRGAGLGLSMARDVAKKHGGTLDVQSVAGQGSTFTLTLPFGASSD